MAETTITEYVEAPPEEVFAAASDFAGAPERIPALVRIEMLTEGPVGVGTRFRETRILFKREASEEMEVTAFEPPRRYTLGAESHGCRYLTEMLFEPEGSGTRVVFRFRATPLSLGARLMSVMMKPMIRAVEKECAKDLAALKRSVEERGNATG